MNSGKTPGSIELLMRARSSCAYQRKPFPATRLRASMSYWNISVSPMGSPMENKTGTRRRNRASRNRRVVSGRERSLFTRQAPEPTVAVVGDQIVNGVAQEGRYEDKCI